MQGPSEMWYSRKRDGGDRVVTNTNAAELGIDDRVTHRLSSARAHKPTRSR